VTRPTPGKDVEILLQLPQTKWTRIWKVTFLLQESDRLISIATVRLPRVHSSPLSVVTSLSHYLLLSLLLLSLQRNMASGKMSRRALPRLPTAFADNGNPKQRPDLAFLQPNCSLRIPVSIATLKYHPKAPGECQHRTRPIPCVLLLAQLTNFDNRVRPQSTANFLQDVELHTPPAFMTTFRCHHEHATILIAFLHVHSLSAHDFRHTC
jgi:hypothetical protein